jgi:hypothetical protein
MREFRGLLNLLEDGRPLLSIALCGLLELDQVLRLDASLVQRVEVRCALGPLKDKEVEEYLAHRLHRAGARAPVFGDDALGALMQYSGGVPRLLNTLADNALFESAMASTRPVTVESVAAAADQLGLALGAAPRPELAPARKPLPVVPRPALESPVRPARAESSAPAAPLSAPVWDEPALDSQDPPEAAPLDLAPEPELGFERAQRAPAAEPLRVAPALELAEAPVLEPLAPIAVPEPAPAFAQREPQIRVARPLPPAAPAVEADAVPVELELPEPAGEPIVEVALEQGEQLLCSPEAEAALAAASAVESEDDELDLSGILGLDPQEDSEDIDLDALLTPTVPAQAAADSGEELDALFAQIQRDE